MQITWRCDDVGGLGEHVTVSCFGFLVYFFFFLYFILGIAPSQHWWIGSILTICTSYDVFPRKEVPFGGRGETAPHLGVKSLPKLYNRPFPRKKQFGGPEQAFSSL